MKKSKFKKANKFLNIRNLMGAFIIIMMALPLRAQNVMISNQNNPNEPSIAIDPKNPNVLIAGANINNCYVSIDTGHTWTQKRLTSSFGVWGDPVICVDTASTFYFFHLSNPPSGTGNWIDRIVCQKTSNNGNVWSNGSYTGLNGLKAQDKQWCAIDRKNNNMYLTWTQFDKYGSSNPYDSSIIVFSKSTDAGDTWTAPVRINSIAGDCQDSDNTVEGAVPTVGPNGEIYVSWAGPSGLVFNKSLDQGNSWLNKELLVSSIPGGWDFSITGIYRANGFPITACDLSNGVNRGTIYINWSDQRNGTNNTDIWLVKSTDGGQTWSSPTKVNDDNSNNQQFFTWMTIDQTTGYLYFVFYDRRNYSNESTDVYMALSTDGGNTFINRKISQSPFLPHAGVFFGDYTNVTAHNGVIRPIWTRLHNGALSVWTSITRLSDFLPNTAVETTTNPYNLTFENYPNPTSDYEYVSFKLRKKGIINLSICDVNGKLITEIIKDESRDYGTYIEKIYLTKLNLPDGTYFLRLEIDNQIKVNRVIKI
jgi:hypothetical protein